MLVPVDIAAWDLPLMADLCRALTARNERIIASQAVPLLWDADVVYRLDPPDEPLYDALRVLSRRAGDCEDLAAWRAAELRVLGWSAVADGDPEHGAPVAVEQAQVVFLDFGHQQYHAVVAVPRLDGGRPLIDDPSARLGMRGAVDPLLLRRRGTHV